MVTVETSPKLSITASRSVGVVIMRYHPSRRRKTSSVSKDHS
jgi:hypothetical protein